MSNLSTLPKMLRKCEISEKASFADKAESEETAEFVETVEKTQIVDLPILPNLPILWKFPKLPLCRDCCSCQIVDIDSFAENAGMSRLPYLQRFPNF